MKIKISLLTFCIFGILSGQNNTSINPNVQELIDSAECITTSFFLADETKSTVTFLSENTISSDNGPTHHYIQSSKENNIKLINFLSRYSALDEIFLMDWKKGYSEQNSEKVLDGKDVVLFIQIDLGSPCHNDTLFVLITEKEKAKKITLDLAKLYNNHKGLQQINAQIKT